MKTAYSVGLVAILMVSSFLVACSGKKPEAQGGGSAPNFALKTADGRTVELRALQGKVVVVNFWATWCGPCKAEIPGMMKVYEKYRNQGLEIVGIALDNGGWNDVNPFVARMNMTYPVVLGDESVTNSYGGVDAIPTTVIVDREGNIAVRHVGYLTQDEFEKQIRNLL